MKSDLCSRADFVSPRVRSQCVSRHVGDQFRCDVTRSPCLSAMLSSFLCRRSRNILLWNILGCTYAMGCRELSPTNKSHRLRDSFVGGHKFWPSCSSVVCLCAESPYAILYHSTFFGVHRWLTCSQRRPAVRKSLQFSHTMSASACCCVAIALCWHRGPRATGAPGIG